jgi:hypothetical protein
MASCETAIYGTSLNFNELSFGDWIPIHPFEMDERKEKREREREGGERQGNENIQENCEPRH